MGAWIAKDKLIVGVTDEALLKKKSNASILESLDARMASVRAFCELFKPSIAYEIVPINDIYGPTGWDANIQALVLSFETREGAAAGECRTSFSSCNHVPREVCIDP
ncbi:hypothetical protein DL93DRAFT_2072344 [Clavulina sp. PMI_390]|nr:hypothetical protein DL93DRAFT_2072344 [Clavulina sp. PMI_390]